MEELKAKKLFEAIKDDNLNEFSSLLTEQSDLNVCFGRFPLLSVMYLFESYSILCEFEPKLLRVSKFEVVTEFYDIYKQFKTKAKKSLRLFSNNDLICYPILMLGVLDERKQLTEKYKNLYKTVEIVDILNKIYKLNCNIQPDLTTDKCDLPIKKRTALEKFKIGIVGILVIIVSLFSVFSLTFVGTQTGLGTNGLPILISNEQEFKTALKKGNRNYKLTNDIVLDEEFAVNQFSGLIDGNGHTIYMSNKFNPLIKNLFGTIQNVKIINKKLIDKISQNFAILAENNCGLIKKVEINLEIDASFTVADDVYVCGVAIINKGTIENSATKVQGAVSNEGQTNCYVTGFVGENYGAILNSKTLESELVTDTVDVAGFAITNYSKLSGLINNIEISQTTNKQWHPNAAGIVNQNEGTIEKCVNNGKIFSKSTLNFEEQLNVYAGGVCCINNGEILKCRNFANISGEGESANVYAAGIACINSLNADATSKVAESKAKGKIYAQTKYGQAFSAGICASSVSTIDHCGYEGEIYVDSENDYAFGSGIVAINSFRMRVSLTEFYGNGNVVNCYSSSKFKYINPDHSEKVRFGSIMAILQSDMLIVPCSNNHYVKDSSFVYSVWVNVNVGIDDASAGAASYEKLEDISDEVLLKDEI